MKYKCARCKKQDANVPNGLCSKCSDDAVAILSSDRPVVDFSPDHSNSSDSFSGGGGDHGGGGASGDW